MSAIKNNLNFLVIKIVCCCLGRPADNHVRLGLIRLVQCQFTYYQQRRRRRHYDVGTKISCYQSAPLDLLLGTIGTVDLFDRPGLV